MKNNKGFTLVELLATLVVLGIIMAIAVPNVISVVQKNRKKTLIEDAKKMLSMAQYKVAKENVTVTRTYTLRELDITEELKKGPNGELYDRNNSKVVFSSSGTYTVFLDEPGYTCIDGLNEGDLYNDTNKTIEILSDSCSN